MKRLVSTALALIMACSPAVTAAAAESRIGIEGKPSGITDTSNGSLLITDIWDMAVWEINGTDAKKLSSDGVRDLLGKVIGGTEDGFIASSSFSTPFDITPYKGGYAVSDTDNNLIRFISGDKANVSTIAGSGYAGAKDGKSTEASFNRPTGLATDADGNLFIANTNNSLIRKLDKDGNVTTYAGDSEGYAVGSLSETRFNMPTDLVGMMKRCIWRIPATTVLWLLKTECPVLLQAG